MLTRSAKDVHSRWPSARQCLVNGDLHSILFNGVTTWTVTVSDLLSTVNCKLTVYSKRRCQCLDILDMHSLRYNKLSSERHYTLLLLHSKCSCIYILKHKLKEHTNCMIQCNNWKNSRVNSIKSYENRKRNKKRMRTYQQWANRPTQITCAFHTQISN